MTPIVRGPQLSHQLALSNWLRARNTPSTPVASTGPRMSRLIAWGTPQRAVAADLAHRQASNPAGPDQALLSDGALTLKAMTQHNQQIEMMAVADLVPYARNSRTHGDAQVAQIAASIREFGFTNPVLIDADGGIIAGHGRVLAARKLGLSEVPCIRLGHLTEAQRRAYIIADNKLALNAGWDDELLALELGELHAADFDMALLGFDASELSIKMGMGADFTPGTEEDQSRLDEKSPITCPACGHEFHK